MAGGFIFLAQLVQSGGPTRPKDAILRSERFGRRFRAGWSWGDEVVPRREVRFCASATCWGAATG